MGNKWKMMSGGDRLVLLLCAALGAVDSITVTTTKSVTEVARGDNVTLPCTYQSSVAPDKRKFTMASWKLVNPDPAGNPTDVITYVTGEDDDVGNQYTGRVSFVSSVEQGIASILINNVAMTDNGTYQCEITIPSDKTGNKIVKPSLLVLGRPEHIQESSRHKALKILFDKVPVYCRMCALSGSYTMCTCMSNLEDQQSTYIVFLEEGGKYST